MKTKAQLKLTLLAISLLTPTWACHENSSLLNGSRVNLASEGEQLEKIEQNAADESIIIPRSITGSYLICQEVEASQIPEGVKKIGCFLEKDGEPILDAIDIVEELDLKVSSADISILQTDDDDGGFWLARYHMQPESENLLSSEIGFELNYKYWGQAYQKKTSIKIIWDEDCYLSVIGFEDLGSLSPGAEISLQYWESHGIRFSTLSGAPVYLFGYDVDEPVAYYGGSDNRPNYLAEGEPAGSFFISDGHKQAENTDVIVIDYRNPAKAASMDLLDLDFSETFVLEAFDNEGRLVDSDRIESQSVDFRDGRLTRFAVQSPIGADEIVRLHISAYNPPGLIGIGYGIDNISPRCRR